MIFFENGAGIYQSAIQTSHYYINLALHAENWERPKQKSENLMSEN
jgi:hypothetical protein